MKRFIIIMLVVAGCKAPAPAPLKDIPALLARWDVFVTQQHAEMDKLNWSTEVLLWREFEKKVKTVQYLGETALKNPTLSNYQTLQAEITADMSRNWAKYDN